MLGNIQMGDMSGMIGAAITIAVAGIVLLTVAPGIVGDIDQIFLNGEKACTIADERFTRVSKLSAAPETADTAWGGTTAYIQLTIPDTATACTAPNPKHTQHLSLIHI